jgi:UDP-glucose 4-epimerase
VRVLVTGGGGFIGSSAVQLLVDRGHEVTVLDACELRGAGFRAIQGDIRDPSVVAAALLPGTDAVVHLAARTSVLDSLNGADEAFRTNVVGTHNLLEAARRAGAERFVMASTNAVVGDVGRTTIDERTPLRPLTPYGATKAACEMLMTGYSAAFELKTVALRFTNVYGPGMGAKRSFITRLMRAAASGGAVQIYGDGEQLRDNVFVLDAVAAIELALALPTSDTLIVGSGASVSVNRLVQLASEAFGVAIAATHVAPKPGEMPAVVVDNSRARSRGWAPALDLASGLAVAWDDFRASAGEPASSAAGVTSGSTGGT